MRSRMQMLAALGAMAVLMTMAPGVGAGGVRGPGEPRGLPVGEDFRISGLLATATDSQPAAAWNPAANEYLVVWMDYRNLSSRGVDIAGQRVSADGSMPAANFAVSGPAARGNESLPAVVWNGTAGEYLVVWSDTRNALTRGTDLAGQRVSAAGTRLGANFGISGPAATADDDEPAAAWNATANEYLVVWMDRRNQATRGSDIYGQRLSAAGEHLGNNFRISGPAATSNEFDAAVVWNATANEYLVVWADQRNNAARGYDIVGQRVSAAGERLGANFGITGPAAREDDLEPTVTWSATANEYLVVWQDGRHSGFGSYDVYGQRMSAAGARLGANLYISGYRWFGNGLKPAAAWDDSANQYLVVWQDRRNESTSGYDIYGQEVSAAGARVGDDFRISGPDATAHEESPAITYNTAADEFLVIWQDTRTPSRGYDIYGRRVEG
jgi:hypothetical protein